jgi:hypothetical protein
VDVSVRFSVKWESLIHTVSFINCMVGDWWVAKTLRASKPMRIGVELLVVVEDLRLILTIMKADVEIEVLVVVTDVERRLQLLVADVRSVVDTLSRAILLRVVLLPVILLRAMLKAEAVHSTRRNRLLEVEAVVDFATWTGGVEQLWVNRRQSDRLRLSLAPLIAGGRPSSVHPVRTSDFPAGCVRVVGWKQSSQLALGKVAKHRTATHYNALTQHERIEDFKGLLIEGARHSPPAGARAQIPQPGGQAR